MCVHLFPFLKYKHSAMFPKLDAGQVVVTEDTRWGRRGEGTRRERRGGEGRREEKRPALPLYFQTVGHRTSKQAESS